MQICVTMGDSIVAGTPEFIESFVTGMKKSFCTGSLETNDLMMFCGQRILKKGKIILGHQDSCIEELQDSLISKEKDADYLVGAGLTSNAMSLASRTGFQSLAITFPCVFESQRMPPC